MRATRQNPGQAPDPALLKATNHYVRQHPFITKSLTSFTTSERRAFERDVHDYARGVGLTKDQAKKEVIKARSFCGEFAYDSDVSALDGETNDQVQIVQKLALPTSVSLGKKKRRDEAHVSTIQSEDHTNEDGRGNVAARDQSSASGVNAFDQNERPVKDPRLGNYKRKKKQKESNAVPSGSSMIKDISERRVEEAAPPPSLSSGASKPGATVEKRQAKLTNKSDTKPWSEREVVERAIPRGPRKSDRQHHQHDTGREKVTHNRADQSGTEPNQYGESQTLPLPPLLQDDRKSSKKRKRSSLEKKQDIDSNGPRKNAAAFPPSDPKEVLPERRKKKRREDQAEIDKVKTPPDNTKGVFLERKKKKRREKDQAEVNSATTPEQIQSDISGSAAKKLSKRRLRVASTSKEQGPDAVFMSDQPVEPIDEEDIDITRSFQSLLSTLNANRGQGQTFLEYLEETILKHVPIGSEASDDVDSRSSAEDIVSRHENCFPTLQEQEGNLVNYFRYVSTTIRPEDFSDANHETSSCPATQTIPIRPRHENGRTASEGPSYEANKTAKMSRGLRFHLQFAKNNGNNGNSRTHFTTALKNISHEDPTCTAVVDPVFQEKTGFQRPMIRAPSNSLAIPVASPLHSSLPQGTPQAVQSGSPETLVDFPPRTPQKHIISRDSACSSPLSSLGSTPDYSPTPVSRSIINPEDLNDLRSLNDQSSLNGPEVLDHEACLSPSHPVSQLSPTKPPTPRPLSTKARSHHFPKRATPGLRKISVIPFPPLSSPNFGLFQERLHTDPFWLLIAVHFLNKTRGVTALPAFYDLMSTFPTPEALAAAEEKDVFPFFARLGLQNRRTSAVISFAQTWLQKMPEKGKRYRKLSYPCKGDGKDIPLAEEPIPDDDLRSAWEIAHLPTVGAYALDSWRIFCRDALRYPTDVNVPCGLPILEDPWDGRTERRLDLAAEWTRVLPTDKELRAYLKWRWMRLGWDWDWDTGEMRELSDQEWASRTYGGIVIEDGQLGKVEIKGETGPVILAESVEGCQ